MSSTAGSPSEPPVRKELTEALEELYRAAGRPSFRNMSRRLRLREDRLSAASHETIRRVLKGKQTPRWETVRDIVVVLSAMCSPPRDEESETARFRPLWRAIDEGESGALKSFQELLQTGWGGEDGKWTPEMVMGIFANPFNAIEIHPSLAVPHDPMVSEEQWVRGMVKSIEEHGAEHMLRIMLHSLKGEYIGAAEGTPYGYQNPDREFMEAEAVVRYGCAEIRRRLDAEPNLLAASIRAMHADETMDRDDKVGILERESDPSLLREVVTLTPATWSEASEEAHHLLFDYLIKQISAVAPFGLPDAERFRIVWRVPEPSTD
ncbi:hypothetical protein ACN20G_19605 [Streptomyces sp. BI20]|uniref:hypothetical protein n=1 Tax=Streptomyces sp. BI20 TaxID=3403460 RepID=UPI003C76A898